MNRAQRAQLEAMPYVKHVGVTRACSSCEAPVVWCTTQNGKPMPMDPPVEGVQPTPHWATCPNAATHRRVKR